jgi:hypothetical protein
MPADRLLRRREGNDLRVTCHVTVSDGAIDRFPKTCPSRAMTVPKGYSPLLTAMRESSIHRAIIALSVAFSEESMSTLPHRLALNRGRLAVSNDASQRSKSIPM